MLAAHLSHRRALFNTVRSYLAGGADAALPPSLHERTSSRRHLSSWQGHGTDLLTESLAHNEGVPKVILKGHGKSGFDVLNLIKNMDNSDEEIAKSGGIVHMKGSILAFPGMCLLWKVRSVQELQDSSSSSLKTKKAKTETNTMVDVLAPVRLFRPKLQYLFLGSTEPIPPSLVAKLRQDLAAEGHDEIVIEAMDLANAMGTFNILNGEDRRVAAALLLPKQEDDE